jgi:hydrogenase expression/formation protein HypD
VNAAIQSMRRELNELCAHLSRTVRIMEVCGTHTVSIFRSGIRSLLPENLRLVSGPGCPVCVTAQRHIDAAIELAHRPNVILATYGDMVRVPGRQGSLEALRAAGARIHVINSAQTALQLARENAGSSVVFLAVGFETTAPATAATVLQADCDGVGNFSVLCVHKQIVPAMLALLAAGDVPLDGFLCPGHVSVIIGAEAYRPIVETHARPCIVAGFEPGLIMAALVRVVRQVAEGRADVENAYAAVVSERGNAVALDLMQRVFTCADTPWRALGVIPQSGLELAPAYRRFDALERFGVSLGMDEEHPGCRCGEVIQGRLEPNECPLFGETCTPVAPVGPCMVSSEGTCAAWYKYGRRAIPAAAPREERQR